MLFQGMSAPGKCVKYSHLLKESHAHLSRGFVNKEYHVYYSNDISLMSLMIFIYII